MTNHVPSFKAKNNSIAKQQHCEDCKNEYAAELQKTNQAQKDHYFSAMPKTFQHLQDMDERRIRQLADFIRQTADVEKNVLPIISTCIDGTFKASEAIDPAAVSISSKERIAVVLGINSVHLYVVRVMG